MGSETGFLSPRVIYEGSRVFHSGSRVLVLVRRVPADCSRVRLSDRIVSEKYSRVTIDGSRVKAFEPRVIDDG